MLKQRIITALILVSCLVFSALHENVWVWRAFVGLMVGVAWWEWLQLANIRDSVAKASIATIGFLAALYGVFSFGFSGSGGLVAGKVASLPNEVLISVSVLWLVLITATLTPKLQTNNLFWSNTAKAIIAIIVLSFFAYGAVWLKEQAGAMWLLILTTIIWIADSGAYFSGKCFGKRKLAAAVSPGKSIEGMLGGLLLVVVYTIALSCIYPTNVALLPAILAAAIIAVVSVGGDLYESWLKRQAGVKDSGSILPGHGGVLDRIDSLLSAMPFMMLSYQLLIQSS